MVAGTQGALCATSLKEGGIDGGVRVSLVGEVAEYFV